jgi:hypothetical protein
MTSTRKAARPSRRQALRERPATSSTTSDNSSSQSRGPAVDDVRVEATARGYPRSPHSCPRWAGVVLVGVESTCSHSAGVTRALTDAGTMFGRSSPTGSTGGPAGRPTPSTHIPRPKRSCPGGPPRCRTKATSSSRPSRRCGPQVLGAAGTHRDEHWGFAAATTRPPAGIPADCQRTRSARSAQPAGRPTGHPVPARTGLSSSTHRPRRR